MSKILSLTSIRIIPRDTNFLNRRIGSRGEIFYDRSSNTLTLYDGQTTGGFKLAKTDLTNISNETFLAKAQESGVTISGGGNSFDLSITADDSTVVSISSGNTIKFAGGDGISTTSSPDGEILISNSNNSFSSLAVSGESTITAEQISDTVNFVAGDNIIITTDTETNSITINSSIPNATNSFSTISVASQPNVVADSTTDTLTLVAGAGISITTDATTDTITIQNTVSSISFDQLTDVIAVSLDIDQIYLPAITRLNVTNSGASAYLFDQYGGLNPTIYAIGGTTIAFKLLATGHPFLIQDSSGNNFNTGLVHVSTTGVITTGINAQGKDSGTLYWKIPGTTSGSYRYQCSVHAPMVGSIVIKNIVTL
jgi:hypothetical protein